MITFSYDEMVVLSDLLFRMNSNIRGFVIEHRAEERMLEDLEATLEPHILEILDPDYQSTLDDARTRLIDSEDQ